MESSDEVKAYEQQVKAWEQQRRFRHRDRSPFDDDPTQDDHAKNYGDDDDDGLTTVGAKPRK